MEHMKMKWRAVFDNEESEWDIESDEDDPWYICSMAFFIDDDQTGEKTAKAICDMHNATITEE
jgi:hypothetical protein